LRRWRGSTWGDDGDISGIGALETATEAEAALHSILVQGSIARMRHGDKSMEWNAQNVGDLRAYIAELKGKLGQNGRGSARRVIF
jgi:hypothetical protein